MYPDDQPPQPNQAPPPWGTPPPGAPAGEPPVWGTMPPPWAPPPAKSGGRLKFVVVAIVIAVIAIAGLVALGSANADAGKVIFTTDQLTESGAKTCQVGTRVTTVKAGSHVWAAYFFSHRLGAGDAVTYEILRDGASIGTSPVPSTQTTGIDCLEDFTDFGPAFNQPGKYEIKLTVNGTTVSDGTLTVTP